MGSLRSIRSQSKQITEAERQLREILIELAQDGILSPKSQEYWGIRTNQTVKDDEK